MPNTKKIPYDDYLSANCQHELSVEEEERLSKLFQTLDVDGNGKIDVHDLSKALHQVGVHEQYAEVNNNCCKLFSKVFSFV